MLANIKNKKIIKYILPSIITFIILAIIFYINNLYPFGNNPLVQVDADFQFIPNMYKIHDLLHHGGEIFYSSIGLGNSIYGSLILQGSLFSPLNLLLFLPSRDNLVNFMGLFIIIKICLLTLTSYIYINYKYPKIKYFYKLLFSIIYTFNGFILLNYFNDMWLDIVILFPILVLFLDKLLNEKKELGYIIVLSLCFIINIYFCIFVVTFILFYTTTNILLFNKKDKKEIIFKLGKGTLIAFLISSFSSVPLLYQIFISDRFNYGYDSVLFASFDMKSLYLLFSPLFVLMFFKLITKYKDDKRHVLKYIILVSLYIIPLIFDPINALMHGGSYWSMPYRHGFVLAFILMDAALYLLSNYKESPNSEKAFSIISIIDIIILGVIDIILVVSYRQSIITNDILLELKDDVYNKLIYIIIPVFFMFLLIKFISSLKLRKIILLIVSLFSIFIFTSVTIFYNEGYFLCKNAQTLHSNIDTPNDGRYKVEYTTYTPDYSYIFNIPTLDNWIHIIPMGLKDAYVNMGYYASDTNIHSFGGTKFTDWLLNFKYSFSNDSEMKEEREEISNYDDKHVYKNDYSSNYGIVFNYDEEAVYDYEDDLDYNSSNNLFDYQNRIYRNLFNTDNTIIDYKYYDMYGDKSVKLDYNIEEDGYLYLYVYNWEVIDYIEINDNIVSDINNYLKYLGRYNNDVHITIFFKENYDTIYFEIGFIKKKDIDSLQSDVIYKEDGTYYVKTTDDKKYLFLPINNIPGIHVYNNNLEVKTLKYLNNFILIKLNKGDNIIRIEYRQPFFKLGLILSIFGLIVLVFYKVIKGNKLLHSICYYAYIGVIVTLFIYYYIYAFFR